MKKLDDLLTDALDKDRLWAKLYYYITSLFCIFKYRIFIRGKCAFKGCKVNYSNYNLSEDTNYWYCSRCDAEGINCQVYTVDLLYDDTKLHNFWDVLKGN